jgi:hypothetical protein
LSPFGVVHNQFLTNYWLSRAPTLAGWRFYSSRQPSAQVQEPLHIGGHTFNRNGFWMTPVLNAEDCRFDVTGWHPVFSRLNERARYTVILLCLHEFLGEHGTCNWIGEIKANDRQLRNAIPISELHSYIRNTAIHRGWKLQIPSQNCVLYDLPDKVGDFCGAIRLRGLLVTQCWLWNT